MEERQKGLNLGWLSDSRNEIYGLAILWIMVFHGYDWNSIDYSFGLHFLKPLQDFINLGNSGVDMFLLLSGISLYFSFSRRPETLGFYKKRYQRLYPPLWIINGFYWFYLFMNDILAKDVMVVKAGGHFVLRMTQLSFWFGNDRQVWYVAAIAVFYFLYPFLFHFLYDNDRKPAARMWLMMVGVVVVLLSARVMYPEMYAKSEIALTRLPIFILGCGMGKLVFERKCVSWWWLALPILLSAGVVAVGVFDLKLTLKNYALWRYLLSVTGFSMTAFCGVLLHAISWKPLHAFLRFFGNMSLELYLAHVTLHHVMLWIVDEKYLCLWQYYVVIAVSIPVAFGVMKLENALFSKKPKKEGVPAV